MAPPSGPIPATIQLITQAKITPFPTQQQASGIYNPDNPCVKELLNSLYEFTDLHPQAISDFSSLSPSIIDGCPHHDFLASTPITTISDTQNNSNDNFNMETKDSLPNKHKEKSDRFTTHPSSKISKFNDIQPNFQIKLANRLNVLSQETAENLTTDSAIRNTVNPPQPNQNTLNAPTPNQNTLNAPNPNYVPSPLILRLHIVGHGKIMAFPNVFCPNPFCLQCLALRFVNNSKTV
ncbi:hypothetical protein TNIN_380011 [Trichonephila inaurata madagascariensis]|uniref:Uncharacterized protein n=1 Tax=Trichonephila inaurata madagascariensis TaxID=2747483 RepID=A0A8X7CD15_9ARAC|nr:hypothetical protein TNIN_380011 [Trichonephila inaurata madagascariensis]